MWLILLKILNRLSQIKMLMLEKDLIKIHNLIQIQIQIRIWKVVWKRVQKKKPKILWWIWWWKEVED